ncbi:MAG: serine hydrolase [Novosphingobium sp.]
MAGKRLIAMALAAMLTGSAPAAFAHSVAVPSVQTATPLERTAPRLLDLLAGRAEPDAALFTEEFLAAIPPGQIKAFVAQLTAQHGPAEAVGAIFVMGSTFGRVTILYDKSRVTMDLRVTDEPNPRITELRITDLQPRNDSMAAIEAEFRALPGAAGFGIYRLGSGKPELVAGFNPQRQFAIGSAFKLWVLDALAADVAAKRRKWSDVVPLGRPSLPSGDMRNWPPAAPVTLHTLAVAMISESDNTATDTLIGVVGRERIGQHLVATGHSAPALTLPFLTTLEAFTLKAGPVEERKAYGAADDAAQARMLAALAPRLDAGKIDPAFLSGKPNAIATIEWFAAAEDLAEVLDSLRRRPDPAVMAILGVNPGVGQDSAARFARVGFKGGSEPGVLNLTWLVQSKDGSWYAVTASWNDPDREVDLQRFLNLGQRLLAQVK